MPSTIWMIQRTMFMGTSFQVEASSCRLEALETSTYSGQGPGPPISPASPITAPWRVERLAPARHHLHRQPLTPSCNDAGMSHFEFQVMVALSRQPDRRLPVC